MVNDLLSVRFPKSNVPEIRGQCIYFDRLYKPNDELSDDNPFTCNIKNINNRQLHRAKSTIMNMWTINRFKGYFLCNRYNERQTYEDKMAYRDALVKTITRLNKINRCKKSCPMCSFANQTLVI